MFRLFTIQPMTNVFENLNRCMIPFHTQVKFGSLVSFLDPPQAVKNCIRAYSLGDIATGILIQITAKWNSMLENFEFKRVCVNRYTNFKRHNCVALMRECAFDKLDTAKKRGKQILSTLSSELR